ncbi:MAG: ribonuclease H-like domain-containing protein [Lentisphaeria bacterium]
MIQSAFRHLPGIGPERLSRLEEAGIRDWGHLAFQSGTLLSMGERAWNQLLAALDECSRAYEAGDLSFFVDSLDTRDHWRILAKYFERATFFDIETTGVDCDSEITVIACYHRGRYCRFFNGENLEEFLDLLEDVELLVSFNGNSFDVPKVERAFNIPGIPCPHLDLRWVCYHQGLRGGLKKIETRLGILRPPDLAFVDGAEAVWLWQRYEQTGDPRLRARLERYCCADAGGLYILAAELLKKMGCTVDGQSGSSVWSELDDCVAAESVPSLSPRPRSVRENNFGNQETAKLSREQRLKRKLRQHRRGRI